MYHDSSQSSMQILRRDLALLSQTQSHLTLGWFAYSREEVSPNLEFKYHGSTSKRRRLRNHKIYRTGTVAPVMWLICLLY